MSTSPRWIASLSRLCWRYPSKMPGNRVRTSKRIGENSARSFGGRGCLGSRFFGAPLCRGLLGRSNLGRGERRRSGRFAEAIGPHLLDQGGHVDAGLSADAYPVIDALQIQLHAVFFDADHRIVEAELLDRLPVARRPRIHHANAKERPMLAAQSLHPDSDCHLGLLGGEGCSKARLKAKFFVTASWR